jgi:hypothetical protein
VPEVADRAARFQDMLRAQFKDALDLIDGVGGLSPDIDTGAVVELLMAASIALNVVVRGAGDCAAGGAVGNGIARMIRGWGPARN